MPVDIFHLMVKLFFLNEGHKRIWEEMGHINAVKCI